MRFKEYINEASLSRFWQHFSNGEPIAIISAERGELSKSENDKNTNSLRRYINSAKFGFSKALGGYSEIDDITGEKKNIDGEKSSIVYSSPEREAELLNFAIGMGKKFNQDSILFIDTEGNAWWYSTRADSSVGPIGSKTPVGKFHPKQIGNYYSKIGKKNFSFVSINEDSYEYKSRPTSVELQTAEVMRNSLKKLTEENKDFYDYYLR